MKYDKMFLDFTDLLYISYLKKKNMLLSGLISITWLIKINILIDFYDDGNGVLCYHEL
jgi:hypothetical protein